MESASSRRESERTSEYDPSLVVNFRAGTTDWKAACQLTSMSIGAGIFTIPQVFANLGTVHASLWVVLIGVLAHAAMQRLLDIAAAHNVDSYEGLAYEAFGPCGRILTSLTTFVTTGIAGLSFMITSKDLIISVIVEFFLHVDINAGDRPVEVLNKTRNTVLLVFFASASMPLTLSPCLGSKAWISRLGVAVVGGSGIFFISRCIALLATGCHGHTICGRAPSAFSGSFVEVLVNAATLAFSYSMVFALFPVLHERVVDGSVAAAVGKVRRSVTASVCACCVLYLLIGLTGSLTFGSNAKPVALNNLPLSEPLVLLVTTLVGVVVLTLVGIVSFPTVQSLEFLVKLRAGDCYTHRTRQGLVFILGVVMVLMATFLPCKAAFALCGSLGLSIGAYTLPCVLYYKLRPIPNQSGGRIPQVITLLVLFFGLALLLASTPATVLNALRSKEMPPQSISELICEKDTALVK